MKRNKRAAINPRASQSRWKRFWRLFFLPGRFPRLPARKPAAGCACGPAGKAFFLFAVEVFREQGTFACSTQMGGRLSSFMFKSLLPLDIVCMACYNNFSQKWLNTSFLILCKKGISLYTNQGSNESYCPDLVFRQHAKYKPAHYCTGLWKFLQKGIDIYSLKVYNPYCKQFFQNRLQ